MNKFEGTPERYMKVPKQHEIDDDALSCSLIRAKAICLLIEANISGGGKTQDGLSDVVLSEACWALEGLIDQARIISSGNYMKEDES